MKPTADPVLSSRGRRLAIEATIVFGLALAVRLVALRYAGMFDEYYHLLAARSYLANGTFSAPDGAYYERAAAFTLLVAASIRAFGDTMMAARIPSLIAGSLMPVVIYLGLRRIDGRVGAAAIAAGFMILDPVLLGLSQVTRFYTVHGLLFWIGVFSLYTATGRTAPPRQRWFNAALAVAVLSGALHLQVTTMIGFGAILVGLLSADSPWIVAQLRRIRRERVLFAALLTIACGGLLLLWLNRSAAAELWDRFGWAPQWLHEADVRYYHWWFQSNYPIEWSLLPLAGLIAMGRRFRLSVTCMVAFAIIFVTQSLAESQLPRYFAYALPCVFIVWGLALRETVPMMTRLGQQLARTTAWPRSLGAALTAGVLLFGALNTPAWLKSFRALNPVAPVAPYQTSDWQAVTPALEEASIPGSAVLSSAGPAALYHLGRLDYEVGSTFLRDGPNGTQFGIDPSIGRPVLSTVASIERVARCFRDGLVIAQDGHWRQEWAVSEELADWLETNLRPLAVPGGVGLRAFVWSGRGEGSSEPECPPRPPRPSS